ncbi:phosphotransferase [Celerinatantimonas sp. MCCC 1A17872]|uniref:phosphotransferase n=1 Tax=Celerinatantimonas sp. MCCC 1A17872 TaxID=3177514 RepID=UPI0038C535F0
MHPENNLHLQDIIDNPLIEQMRAENKKIGHLDLDYQRVWVKRCEQTKSNLFHCSVYALTHMKILMPVANKSAEQSLEFEASKLKLLAELGVNVPKVIGHDEQFLYLADTGRDLRSYFKKTPLDKEQRTEVILKALEQLAKIHNAGNYHAGAQIKNYTIDESGMVSAIDFEDSFDDQWPLIDIQFRDLFLFLFSLSSLGDQGIYAKVLERYLELTGNIEIQQRLTHTAKRLTPLLKLVGFFAKHNHLSHDIMGVYTLLYFLSGLG